MAPEVTSRSIKAAATKAAAKAWGQEFVTFLAGSGDYVKSVVGLAKGLRKSKSKYPQVVAMLPDVSKDHRRILEERGCIVREIEPVYPPENQTQFAMAYYVINYFKLRIWKMDCFCEKTWEHSPQYKIGYCQQCPEKVRWPAELGPKPPLYFNTGMFVYQPGMSTYDDLHRTLKVTPPTSFAEQDFLNTYFRDVYRPIPPIYNLVMALLWRHLEKIELDKVKVVHCCAAGSKPWRYTGKEENMDREDVKLLVQKWWDIYNDESLDYDNYSEEQEDDESMRSQQLLQAALSEAGVVHYITAPSAA